MYCGGAYMPSMKVKTRKLNRLLMLLLGARLFATIRNMLTREIIKEIMCAQKDG